MTYIDEIAERIRSQVPPEDLPSGDTSPLFRTYALLALSVGKAVTPEHVHNAWVAWIQERDPSHSSLVPFADLDKDTQQSDQVYVDAIRKVAEDNVLLVRDNVEGVLFPSGIPAEEPERSRLFELYKVMVGSSEALVSRRQGMNTYFLTLNGAILTALGLFIRAGGDDRLKASGIAIIALAGCILCMAWRSLIRSFGQLNTGKFAVIHRLEGHLPAKIYAAEWEALERGENPKVYRSFTSREIWAPNVLVLVYVLATILSGLVALGWWMLNP